MEANSAEAAQARERRVYFTRSKLREHQWKGER